MNALDKKLQEIANALLSYKPIKYGFEGCRGVALFLLQYYKHSNNELFYDKAITLIEKEFKHYSNIYNDLSFCSGIS